MIEFWEWWQHLPSRIDPVIFNIGWLRPQYYGLMYLVAFATSYGLIRYRIKTEPRYAFPLTLIGDLYTWGIVGLFFGGRLGYVIFYNLPYYLANPMEILLPFKFANGLQFTGIAGMSYHGGVAGIIVGAVLFCRKYKQPFWQLADLVIPTTPLAYTFGRIGNFINGELYGRATQKPWGMYFPMAGDGSLHHPSQLYEAFLEGILLFAILWPLRKQPLPTGSFLGLYLIGYGSVRFVAEFWRQPDVQLGFVLGPFSMGQVLCLAMILIGGVIIWMARRFLSRT